MCLWGVGGGCLVWSVGRGGGGGSKGGMFSELIKNTLSVGNKCDEFRGIRVSDVLSKHVHSWTRRSILPTFNKIARPTQHGGVANKGTALCAHLGREFFAYGFFTRQCSSQLYVDVVGAFDSVFRQLLLDVPLTDEVVA